MTPLRGKTLRCVRRRSAVVCYRLPRPYLCGGRGARNAVASLGGCYIARPVRVYWPSRR
ncbi:hypothetical protein HTIA_2398 [Halorhabdus tiamatea SARL4B]|uniref:Uncharacterized protein n=1 Tax=Halorhabdus tiamatea SARL4B TaxID=1033806 RepID=S6D932_9EURY|nr:hypothetical protein HTIA_2398 [Halorhabdus tiamatea SARL4B]